MRKTVLVLTLLFLSAGVFAQVRPAEAKASPTPDISKVPKSYAAKYEGGFYGSSKKMKGSLRIDEDNERLVFFDEQGKERISLAYEAFLAVFQVKNLFSQQPEKSLALCLTQVSSVV